MREEVPSCEKSLAQARSWCQVHSPCGHGNLSLGQTLPSIIVLNILQLFSRSTAQDVLYPAARVAMLLVPLGLFGCGGGPALTVTNDPGASPFISLVHLRGTDLNSTIAVQYTIAPKPGSASSPVHVEYSIAALQARGYVSDGNLTVPVYGLYAGYDNQVAMELVRSGQDAVQFEVDITTDTYVDPTGIYSQPDIIVKRAVGSALGFSFIYVKSDNDSPVILDTDGEIRWAVPDVPSSLSSAFVSDQFIIGNNTTTAVYRMGLDGQISTSSLPSTPADYIDFGHDITYGKVGLLAEPDAMTGSVEDVESNLIEMRDDNGATILNNWDLGAIISNYMTSQGDDAAAFVRPGKDWFHLNSAIYDPSDDSVIVSSRENFVIKLDYSTSAIKWILGDPTKYWYTFPSLRAKALTLAAGGLYPIGQHALSINPEGQLMLFNDGLGSANQPAGEPAGQTRTYSAVSAYTIDPTSMTATNVWNYEAGQAIFSPICSSAYQTQDLSMLVDYATADNISEAILVGLDPNQNVVFEFQYPTYECNTSWNSRPFPLDNLQITK
jgi:arylsulfate sulfotransferase